MNEADVQLQFDLTSDADIKYKAALQILDFEIEMRAKLGSDDSNNFDF